MLDARPRRPETATMGQMPRWRVLRTGVYWSLDCCGIREITPPKTDRLEDCFTKDQSSPADRGRPRRGLEVSADRWVTHKRPWSTGPAGGGAPGGLMELIETHFISPRLGETMTEAWRRRPCCQRGPDGGQTCALAPPAAVVTAEAPLSGPGMQPGEIRIHG
ncbi:unnamed protein product [Boreogadus saida]